MLLLFHDTTIFVVSGLIKVVVFLNLGFFFLMLLFYLFIIGNYKFCNMCFFIVLQSFYYVLFISDISIKMLVNLQWVQ